jgi:hypothetical protein
MPRYILSEGDDDDEDEEEENELWNLHPIKKKKKKTYHTFNHSNRHVIKKPIFILMMFLICLSLVSAAPKPLQTVSSQGGLTISYPAPGYLKVGAGLSVRFWVYNNSNGGVMTNASAGVNCTYNIIDGGGSDETGNIIGKNILRVSTPTSSGIRFGDLGPSGCANCFNLEISGGNFSHHGSYEYQIRCGGARDNTLGGFLIGEYEVNSVGETLTPERATLYTILWLMSLLVFAGLLIAGIKIPSNNKSDAVTGYVIAVSNLKYLKMFCIALAYLTATFIFYYTWMISIAYLDFSFMSEIFRIIFYAMTILIIPFFVLMIYILIANWTRDSQIKDFLSRGLKTR